MVINKRFFLFLLILLSSFSSYAASHENKPTVINIVYETTHNPPRALGSGTFIDWNKPGLTLELLRLVEKKLNITFKYKRMPWKRGLYLVEKNIADGIFHASYKSSREKIAVYPINNNGVDTQRAIFNQSYVLYKRNDSSLDYYDKNIVNNLGLIGTVSNYSVGEDLRKMNVPVIESINQEINFKKLEEGSISAFANLENMGDDFLQRNNDKYPNIVKVKTALKSKPYYLLFSHQFVKKNPELSQKIWNSIAEIKKSDQFSSLIKKY